MRSGEWVPAHGVASTVDRAGAVYAYKRTAGGISSPQVLISPQPEANALFGIRTAISGDTLLVSENSFKAVHVFNLATGWKSTLSIPAPVGTKAFGIDIAIENSLVAIGAPGNKAEDSGTFVYELSGSSATEVAVLKHATLSAMGSAVAISNGRVASASGYQCEGCAKIVVYERSGSSWVAGTPFGPGAGLAVPEGLEPLGFGWSGMNFQGDTLLIGAAFESYGGTGVNPDRSLVQVPRSR